MNDIREVMVVHGPEIAEAISIATTRPSVALVVPWLAGTHPRIAKA